jgi:hypothetical protein
MELQGTIISKVKIGVMKALFPNRSLIRHEMKLLQTADAMHNANIIRYVQMARRERYLSTIAAKTTSVGKLSAWFGYQAGRIPSRLATKLQLKGLSLKQPWYQIPETWTSGLQEVPAGTKYSGTLPGTLTGRGSIFKIGNIFRVAAWAAIGYSIFDIGRAYFKGDPDAEFDRYKAQKKANLSANQNAIQNTGIASDIRKNNVDNLSKELTDRLDARLGGQKSLNQRRVDAALPAIEIVVPPESVTIDSETGFGQQAYALVKIRESGKLHAESEASRNARYGILVRYSHSTLEEGGFDAALAKQLGLKNGVPLHSFWKFDKAVILNPDKIKFKLPNRDIDSFIQEAIFGSKTGPAKIQIFPSNANEILDKAGSNAVRP